MDKKKENTLLTAGILVAALACLKVEHDIGCYECPTCGHRWVPSMKEMVLAPHIGFNRYMTCPNCSERGLNKKYFK